MDTSVVEALSAPAGTPYLHKSRFIIYDIYGEPIEGWSDGTRWNGWATPLFEHGAALSLVEQHNNLVPLRPNDRGKAWYDGSNDQFCFLLAGGDEIEYYRACERKAGSQELTLYAIGAYYWTWEEYQECESVQ